MEYGADVEVLLEDGPHFGANEAWLSFFGPTSCKPPAAVFCATWSRCCFCTCAFGHCWCCTNASTCCLIKQQQLCRQWFNICAVYWQWMNSVDGFSSLTFPLQFYLFAVQLLCTVVTDIVCQATQWHCVIDMVCEMQRAISIKRVMYYILLDLAWATAVPAKLCKCHQISRLKKNDDHCITRIMGKKAEQIVFVVRHQWLSGQVQKETKSKQLTAKWSVYCTMACVCEPSTENWTILVKTKNQTPPQAQAIAP